MEPGDKGARDVQVSAVKFIEDRGTQNSSEELRGEILNIPENSGTGLPHRWTLLHVGSHLPNCAKDCVLDTARGKWGRESINFGVQSLSLKTRERSSLL